MPSTCSNNTGKPFFGRKSNSANHWILSKVEMQGEILSCDSVNIFPNLTDVCATFHFVVVEQLVWHVNQIGMWPVIISQCACNASIIRICFLVQRISAQSFEHGHIWKCECNFLHSLPFVFVYLPIIISRALSWRTTGPNWLGSPLSTIWALIFSWELHRAIGSNVKHSVALSHSSMKRWVKWFGSKFAWSRRPETVNVDIIIRYLYSSDKLGMHRSSKFELSSRSSLLQDRRTDAANLSSYLVWRLSGQIFWLLYLQSDHVVFVIGFGWNRNQQTLSEFVTHCIWLSTN